MTCPLFSAACRPGAAAVGWSGRRPSTLTAVGPALLPKRPSAARHRFCSRRDDADEFGCDAGAGLVDEGMLVLRRRIHEARAAERGWEPPAGWAAWEKEWYGTYDADVCHLLGLLQALLIRARPGVGVGVLAALVLSVPTAAFVLLSHLLDASRAVASGLHL